MIMVNPRLPWLVLGAGNKPNSVKDSVESHVSTFYKVNSTKESVQLHVSALCYMFYSCSQKDKR